MKASISCSVVLLSVPPADLWRAGPVAELAGREEAGSFAIRPVQVTISAWEKGKLPGYLLRRSLEPIKQWAPPFFRPGREVGLRVIRCAGQKGGSVRGQPLRGRSRSAGSHRTVGSLPKRQEEKVTIGVAVKQLGRPTTLHTTSYS